MCLKRIFHCSIYSVNPQVTDQRNSESHFILWYVDDKTLQNHSNLFLFTMFLCNLLLDFVHLLTWNQQLGLQLLWTIASASLSDGSAHIHTLICGLPSI